MKKFLLGLCVSAVLSGCSLLVGEDYFGEGWKGESVEQLTGHWGEPESTTNLENGGQELIYKLFNDSCTYVFYTDASGDIINYKYQSTFLGTCKPIG
ncbi:hypothetical protein BIY21_07560 [Vibrio ponticus]|uniref:Lipoprotein n=1 Tax=Vibrio ponticus TaxID=265668 RepID=A0ABX3FMB3_9VIBR|nr:hypothetical protein [Vibrio ponticus]OLQ95065.1 hypothetical protein BIY21_07560 [Vibrio ponticus]